MKLAALFLRKHSGLTRGIEISFLTCHTRKRILAALRARFLWENRGKFFVRGNVWRKKNRFIFFN